MASLGYRSINEATFKARRDGSDFWGSRGAGHLTPSSPHPSGSGYQRRGPRESGFPGTGTAGSPTDATTGTPSPTLARLRPNSDRSWPNLGECCRGADLGGTGVCVCVCPRSINTWPDGGEGWALFDTQKLGEGTAPSFSSIYLGEGTAECGSNRAKLGPDAANFGRTRPNTDRLPHLARLDNAISRFCRDIAETGGSTSWRSTGVGKRSRGSSSTKSPRSSGGAKESAASAPQPLTITTARSASDRTTAATCALCRPVRRRFKARTPSTAPSTPSTPTLPSSHCAGSSDCHCRRHRLPSRVRLGQAQRAQNRTDSTKFGPLRPRMAAQIRHSSHG